ncbi:MAG TPA: hypothetical protein VGS08_02050 [Candidatus Saccharimonadales bacterium]|nr:hypothetical protein [Candidatus Saccharimonadales bacterium]
MFTDYYYGIILSSLAVIALTFWHSRSFSEKVISIQRSCLAFLLIASIDILTTFSDPLFIIQFYLPFLIAIFTVWLFNKISLKQMLGYVTLNTAAVGLGYSLRSLIHQFIVQNVNSYVHLYWMYKSFSDLNLSYQQLIRSTSGTLKLLILASLVVLAIVHTFYSIYKSSRSRTGSSGLDGVPIFVSWFVIASVITLMLEFVVSGSVTTRYMLPILIFPILTLLVFTDAKLPFKNIRISPYIAILILLILSIFIVGISKSEFEQMANGKDYVLSNCLDNWANGKNVAGLGAFGIARELSLYSSKNVFIIQMDNNLTADPWLINLASYKGHTYSFVVVDKIDGIDAATVAPLGPPSSITTCRSHQKLYPTYRIYDYKGTEGEIILNKDIQSSLKHDLQKLGFQGRVAR